MSLPALHSLPDSANPATVGAHPLNACRCARHTRRRFTGGLLAVGTLPWLPAQAREGVDVGPKSGFANIVSAQQIEQAAGQQYLQMQQQAARQRALAPAGSPQLVRLRAIAQRLIPYTYEWNARARQWRWEVSLIASPQINAFCMPGGKIAFYTGILERLRPNFDPLIEL